MKTRTMKRRDVNYDNLAAIAKYKDPQWMYDHLQESFEDDNEPLEARDFNVKQLAEAFLGRDYVANILSPGRRSGLVLGVQEAAVDTTAFKNITGQIFYNEILAGWNYADEGVAAMLVSETQSNLETEKIPGIGKIGADGYKILPGHPYPVAGLSEQYIDTPATVKYGLIIELTKEDVFFDKTGQLLDRAREVGEVLAVNKLERICQLVAGVVNNFNWNGTAYDTYQTATPWINKQTGTNLVNWESVNTARQLLRGMRHPETSKPIVMRADTLVVVPDIELTAHQIVNATEILSNPSAGTQEMKTANPLRGVIRNVVASEFLKQALLDAGVSASNAAKAWWHGDFKRAFKYRKNWDITVVQAPVQNEAEFTRDVNVRYKASERGVAEVREPRAVVYMPNA